MTTQMYKNEASMWYEEGEERLKFFGKYLYFVVGNANYNYTQNNLK